MALVGPRGCLRYRHGSRLTFRKHPLAGLVDGLEMNGRLSHTKHLWMAILGDESIIVSSEINDKPEGNIRAHADTSLAANISLWKWDSKRPFLVPDCLRERRHLGERDHIATKSAQIRGMQDTDSQTASEDGWSHKHCGLGAIFTSWVYVTCCCINFPYTTLRTELSSLHGSHVDSLPYDVISEDFRLIQPSSCPPWILYDLLAWELLLPAMSPKRTYHSTGNLYSQSINFQKLISICSYSSGIFPNFLFVQLQFLSLGGLFSYAGRLFTGTRPSFPQLISLLLSHCVPCCGCFGASPLRPSLGCAQRAKSLEKQQHFWAQRNKIPGKMALLGEERTIPLEKQHCWMQSEQNPWGSSFVLLGFGLVYWWDILYRWNFGGRYLFMQLQLANFQELIL